jgi:acetyl esterase/lipase
MPSKIELILEPAAQQLADATSTPPFLYELDYATARKLLDDLQAGPVEKLPVDEQWITVPASVGDARVRIIKPRGAEGLLPVILYMHGGGWVLGNALTHDRLVRELAVGSSATLAFVEYPNSPEARYPVAIEQAYAMARWLVREGAESGLDGTRIAVAGDSAGGNMATVLTLMAKDRGDVRFVHAQMYYPVTDAAMDTESYKQFADGPYITRKTMEWFWDAYIPDPAERFEITASPNQATIDQLRGLPPTLILVDEADVLRDEGEAYAAKLRLAGVAVTTVRYDGICHDFMNLNALSQTSATRAAIAQAIDFFRRAFDSARAGAAQQLHGGLLLEHGVEVPQHAELTEDHRSGRVTVEQLDPPGFEAKHIAARRVHPVARRRKDSLRKPERPIVCALER